MNSAVIIVAANGGVRYTAGWRGLVACPDWRYETDNTKHAAFHQPRQKTSTGKYCFGLLGSFVCAHIRIGLRWLQPDAPWIEMTRFSIQAGA